MVSNSYSQLQKDISKLSQENTFNRLLFQSNSLINYYATRTTAKKLGMEKEDIVSEMMVKIYETHNKYKEKPEDEQLKIIKVTLRRFRANLIRRQDTNENCREAVYYEDENELLELSVEPNQLKRLIDQSAIKQMKSLLTDDALKVLDLLVNPPADLEKLINVRSGCSDTVIPRKMISKYLNIPRDYANILIGDLREAFTIVFPEISPISY